MNLKRFVDTPLSKLVTGHVLPLMIVTALWAGCNILKAQSEAGRARTEQLEAVVEAHHDLDDRILGEVAGAISETARH